ncbi:hypothetical protein DACRYDRAFT_112260 [Dacryopinax primogenitus]|uniref:Serine hydrolase domain-containing protein n=1 Tax=Dacryopinax primogenitus (strain DJM 731) TaxID=1858805 RepID=M5FUJ6_DACPD|nr:uncharacterized protein DACRYDRAFT_112260 [Dacryopinax primogenitus]EJT96921.1 hypothetical protein DACRYDRAFT_112260 [Dacryopinax primogenitus]
MSKLRVLALHGYGQNTRIFRAQGMRNIEFVFLDAPHILYCPTPPTASLVDDNGFPLPPPLFPSPEDAPRGWCTSNAEKTRYYGLDASLEPVRALLARERIDQHISVLTYVSLARRAQEMINPSQLAHPSLHPLFANLSHPPLRFALLFSGFPPRDPPLSSLSTPSLHVLGRTDTHMPHADSLALARLCRGGRVEMHEGGHWLPTKKTWRGFRSAYMRGFLDRGESISRELKSPVPWGACGEGRGRGDGLLSCFAPVLQVETQAELDEPPSPSVHSSYPSSSLAVSFSSRLGEPIRVPVEQPAAAWVGTSFPVGGDSCASPSGRDMSPFDKIRGPIQQRVEKRAPDAEGTPIGSTLPSCASSAQLAISLPITTKSTFSSHHHLAPESGSLLSPDRPSHLTASISVTVTAEIMIPIATRPGPRWVR